MSKNNHNHETGNGVFKDIVIGAFLFLTFGDFLYALWVGMREKPGETAVAFGELFVRAFNENIDKFFIAISIFGIGVVLYFGFVYFTDMLDKGFSVASRSKILSSIVKIGLVGLVGGWIYFIFT